MRCVQISQPIRVNAESLGHEQAPVSQCLAKRSMLVPATSADVKRTGKHCQSSVIPQRFHQSHIFHQANVWEAAE